MKKHLSGFFQVGLGVLLASLGLKVFLLSNGFLDGGVTGIAILLSELYGLNISLVLVAVSLPFLVMSWFTLSRKITLKSIFEIISLVGLMIVSEKSTLIEKELIEVLKTGTTLYSGSKGFGKRGTRSETYIIHTVINRIDIQRTYNLLEAIDKNVFIIEFDANNIKGGILKEYMNKESIKILIPRWK